MISLEQIVADIDNMEQIVAEGESAVSYFLMSLHEKYETAGHISLQTKSKKSAYMESFWKIMQEQTEV